MGFRESRWSRCFDFYRCKEIAEYRISITFYFFSDTPRGFKLFPATQDQIAREGDLNLQIVSDLISGEGVPLDPQYVDLWGNGNTVNSVTVELSVATIELGKITLNAGDEGEQRAINQIVWTLTKLAPEITEVAFTVNGEKVESFAGYVVEEGFTTASSGCPERGDWHITIKDLAPGYYKFEALEYSAEDSSLFAIDEKEFVIK